jgi:aminopeptidase N
LRLYSDKFTETQRDTILSITSKAFRYFEQITGHKYPFGTYTQVLTDDDNEQEAAGFCLLSNDYIASVLKEPKEDWLIIHELAHQWFGNSITCETWSHFWLNEGIVTFLTAEYKGVEFGQDERDREIFLARMRYKRIIGTQKDRPIVWDKWKTPEDMSGIVTYYKGALVLNYLQYVIGKTAFGHGLKTYCDKYWLGTATTVNFQNEMETSSHKNLQRFFDDWVYGVACPTISAKYNVANKSVLISQDSIAFELPISMSIDTKDGRTIMPIVLTKDAEVFNLPVEDTILSVQLDDEGALPIEIETNEPLSMVFYHVTHAVTSIGKVAALSTLHRQFAVMDSANKTQYHLLLEDGVGGSARLIKAICQRYLDELGKH